MPKHIIKCCIPGCNVPDVSKHRFPNLRKYRQMFDRWLEIINLTSLRELDPEMVYQHKRVCSVHFDTAFKSPGNPRLHFGAFPSRNLPGKLELNPDPSKDLPVTSENVTPEIFENAVETTAKLELKPDPSKDLPGTSENVTPEIFENAVETTEQALIPVGVSSPVPLSPTKYREEELLRSVTVNRRAELTPKARKMYDIANVFKRRASRSRKKCSSFKQKLAAAEEYSKSDTFQKVVNNLTPTAENFLWMQIRELAKNPEEHTFTTDEKTLALSLFRRSPKGYDLLQEMFCLPCRKTLNNSISICNGLCSLCCSLC